MCMLKVGKEEWLTYKDIIKRQVLVSRNLNNYSGFSLFRYAYLFNSKKENSNTLIEKENLFNLIK